MRAARRPVSSAVWRRRRPECRSGSSPCTAGRSPPTPGAPSRLYRWADRLMRPLTTVTICVSESERAAGLEAGTCDRGADGRDPQRGRRRRRRRAAASRRATRLIVAVGRLKAPKDFLTLVRALGSPARLVRGRDRRRRARPAAARGRDRPARPEGRVRLAGERRDVPELLAAADVFVLSSPSRGCPSPCSRRWPPASGGRVASRRRARAGRRRRDRSARPPGDPNRSRPRSTVCSAIASCAAGSARRAARAEQSSSTSRRFRRAHLELYSRELASAGCRPLRSGSRR